MQLGDLDPGLHPEGRVEVGQRLVEQEDAGLAYDGTADGDALALSTGKLLGQALEERRQVQDLGRALHPRVNVDRVGLRQLQAEGHVVVDRHVRVERVALKHHGDAARRWGKARDVAAADRQAAARNVFEARHHAQQRGLAAARWPDEDAELAVRNVEVDGIDDLNAAEALVHVLEPDVGHNRVPSSRHARPCAGHPRSAPRLRGWPGRARP